MKLSRCKLRVVFIGVVLVLAACAGGGGGEADETPTEAAATETAQAIEEETAEPTEEETAEPTEEETPEAGGEVVDIDDLTVGDCFNAPEGFSVVEHVPCEQPHVYEIFATVTHPGDGEEYPGDEAVTDTAEELCEPEFEPYVGVDYQSSELYATTITPTQDSWAEGDRNIVCALHEEDEREITGSQEGADR
jgi:hypothetical protein